MYLPIPDEPGVTVGAMPFRDGTTWYRVTGALEQPRLPLVALHGGPGAAHDYLLGVSRLAADGRAVVHYDQFGCGRSSHRPGADPASWTVELFVEELAALVDHLGLADGFHLLGQSWGGMLAAEYTLARPAGVRSLSICNSPASMRLWVQAANELRARLPAQVQQTLLRHEEAGSTDSAEYAEATLVFYRRHVCRLDPFPGEVQRSFDQIEADPTVYHTMNGPSEFHVVGSLADWSVVDRLGAIRVPALVLAGEFDEATPATWAPFVQRLPDVRQHVVPAASHMSHVENPADFDEVVGAFLREHDPSR